MTVKRDFTRRRDRLERLIAGGEPPIPKGHIAGFARRYGLDATYLSQLLSGHRSLGEKAARTIEDKCGLPERWFDDDDPAGALTSLGDTLIRQDDKATENLRSIPVGVPLLAWPSASFVPALAVVKAVDDPSTHYFPALVSCSPAAFALRVDGLSMLAAGGTASFAPGDVIYIDPARPARHGSFVLARLPDEVELVFRQLLVEGERRYLQALNPSWPNRIVPLPAEGEVIGVVVFSGRPHD